MKPLVRSLWAQGEGWSVLALAAGTFLAAALQRVWKGFPRHSSPFSCSGTAFLLSSAFQHEHSASVNVTGAIVPAMPGSRGPSGAVFAFPITKHAYLFIVFFYLAL